MGRIRAKVDASGRLVVPAELRAQLGLDGPGELLMTVVDGELRAMTRATAIRKAQEIVRAHIRPGAPSMLDELLAERRAEAAHFAAECEPPERPAE
ncbi:MAG: MraZ N-terminal domain containing protein [Acetobacteraceae bacterium]|nr:MraZ N-terminal domain containing protein [Acetobacteraceae bacterium]